MRRFVFVGLALVVVSAAVVGRWSSAQTEALVVERSAAFTAVFVDSYVAHYLDGLALDGSLTAADLAGLDRLLTETSLGDDIVSLKVWTRDGQIIYSTDPSLVGRSYPDNPDLARSLSGEVTAEITDLQDPENAFERRSSDRLIETYAPVRIGATGDVDAVVEFYQRPEQLERELRDARARTWLVIGGSMIATFGVLAALFSHAAGTIGRQRTEIDQRIAEIDELNRRIGAAVGSAAASNEQMLRRIAAELHDGPAQQLGAVLLDLEPREHATEQSTRLRDSLESALTDVRRIAAGVRAPDLRELTTCEAIGRAVSDHQRSTGHVVDVSVDRCVDRAPLAVRISMYRVVQEALRNASRHGQGASLAVRAACRHDEITVTVSDDGPGFDPAEPRGAGHLGLLVMRERVESLGGRFDVASEPGSGTVVGAWIPLGPRATP